MNHKAPLMILNSLRWHDVLRNVTRATDERTVITATIPTSGVGHSSSVIGHDKARAIASALVLANMNSLPLDWAARLSVGGVNMSFFIVKQLPVLYPQAYLCEPYARVTFAELILPRVLELTYTARDLEGFARDLGYKGEPFSWDEHRRHSLKCEVDAIYTHMYGLDRSDLEWILDAQPPSASFPTLKRNEIKQFGEYRTQRYVLQAYDQLQRGEAPTLV